MEGRMKNETPVFSSQDLIREIYRGNIDKISDANVSADDDDYLKYLFFVEKNALDWPIPLPADLRETDDDLNQKTWFMPKEYLDLDISKHIRSLCKTQKELIRVEQELELFEKHDMMYVLRFLKYMVDSMRSNNILWGVGRGSSVASYCLYLLGIHKIDSIKYHLDINEFLR